MSSDLGQEPSYDTHLARLLHERGRVEVQVLQGYLARAREQRALDPSLSLALTLVQGGVLSREEADRYLAELRPSGRLAQTHAAPSEAEPATTGWRPGGHVDRYAILDQLGQGGMGTVYLAERDGEQFAIKVLPLETDPDLQARFQREYDAQSAINPHPNVLRIRGAGVGAGARYLVLDLATGGDLQERLRQGPLPVGEAINLCRQLARGLAHVHAHGILHRDIKPGNVLFDADGTPKLVDFGLARSTRRSESSLTRTGELLGTPSYMAPEQATGVRGEVGVASDLYGLAALLFHTLTGRPPFVGASTLDVLTQVVTSPPPRPSSIRAEVSPELDAVILKALSKAPEDRHGSAAELADALERVGATPPTRRVPLGLVAAAAASLLAAIGAIALRSGSPAATPTPVAKTAMQVDPPIPAPPTGSAVATPRDPLGIWNPPVGTQLETDVLFNSKRTWLFDGRPTDALAVNGEAGGSLTLHGKVARSGAQIAIDVTVAAWSLREVGFIVQDRIFDSKLPNARKNPLYAAVGKTFRFTMDARTGQVGSVEGLEAIQAAILASSALDLGAKEKVDLFTEPQMFDALNLVWHCLPASRTDSAGQPLKHWRVTPAPPRRLEVLQNYAKSAFSAHDAKAVGPPSAGPLTKVVTVTNRRGDRLFASWKGSADTRRASAFIVIEDGLVREAKIRHSISFPGERKLKDRTVEVEWRFDSTYTARLKIVTPR